jgi:hypothetical protein
MPQKPGEHSISKRAGRYQRQPMPNPPPRVTVRWTELDDGPNQPTYWWRPDGRLFYDRELTEPTRPALWILEVEGDVDWNEDDDDNDDG